METKTTAPKQESTNKVYGIVTDKIIKQLEHGTVPWRQPWTDAGIPTNIISGKPYRGINIMLLASLGYERNQFITSKQLGKIGGSIKPDEKPYMVVYWNFKDKNGELLEDADGRKKPILRYYTVFNVEQCVWPLDMLKPEIPRVTDPLPLCEAIIEKMPKRPEIRFKELKAYYDALRDFVNMPKQKSFESDPAYYSTLFHELVHSTGHVSRLSRKDLIQMSEFGSEPYSHEELVAEIGTCYLQSFAGITGQFEQSAAYIQGWLNKLRNDKHFIFSASTHAQRAVDFILNVQREVEQEQNEE